MDYPFCPFGYFRAGVVHNRGDGFRRAGGLCEAACGAVGLYGVYRAGGQSRHRVVENPPQPLSAGVYLPARKRRVCLLYPFFRRQYPREYGFGEKLGLHEDTYSISIPLGATVNMGGAAITITVLAMAAAHTQGIQVDFATALLLSLVATVSACGASGVVNGSLLLIPLACSLFGISNDVAMQVVAVGFIIGVIQDSAETALNSSTDVLFTAAADLGRQRNRAE